MQNALTARRIRRKIRRKDRTRPSLGFGDGFGAAFGGLAEAGIGIWQGMEKQDLEESRIKAERDIAIAKANAEAAVAAAAAERAHALALAGKAPSGGIPVWAYGAGAAGLALVAFLAFKR
jgi:hypothetical protein